MRRTIYETKGRAREFAELAINLYDFCSHGCIYCYSPDVIHKNRGAFSIGQYPRITAQDIVQRDYPFIAGTHSIQLYQIIHPLSHVLHLPTHIRYTLGKIGRRIIRWFIQIIVFGYGRYSALVSLSFLIPIGLNSRYLIGQWNGFFLPSISFCSYGTYHLLLALPKSQQGVTK